MHLEAVVLSHATKKILSIIESKFTSAVITRWSDFRARQFFISLITEMDKQLKGIHNNNFDTMLLEMLDDDKKSEILFESYRRVVLSASKATGPRIIGILTAKLIVECREANETEEIIAMAAEALNDSELRAASQFYHSEFINTSNESEILEEKYCFKILLFNETQNLLSSKSSINTTPINFASYYGSWAQKLSSFGVMNQEIIEKALNYEAIDDRYDGKINEKKLSYYLLLEKKFLMFFDLVDTALRMGEI